VLVLSSTGSDNYLRNAARDLTKHLSGAEYREVDGGWHGTDEKRLAEVLSGWFCPRICHK
jgi:hypothetical protein